MAPVIARLLILVAGAFANRAKWGQDFQQALRSSSELQVATSTGCFFWESDCKDTDVLCGPNAIVFGKVTENHCQQFVYLWNHAESECSAPDKIDQFQMCFWETVDKFIPPRDTCDVICADSHGSIPQKIQDCHVQCDHVYDCKDKCQQDEYKFRDSIGMCFSDCMENSPVNPTGTCKGACNKHAPNGKCQCDPTCVFLDDCCKDYENYCKVTSLQPGQQLGAPAPPEFNISRKDIKSFKARYAVNAKPVPPLPGKAPSPAPPMKATHFLQSQAAPDIALQSDLKLSELLERKVAAMVRHLMQSSTEDSRRAMLLPALESFLRSKPPQGHSKPEAKVRINALVKNLLAVQGQGESYQPPDDLPPPPPLVPAAPAAVADDQDTAAEIGEQSDKLGHAVEDINGDVNDIFHLLEQQEYWQHRTPVLKNIVMGFTSGYQASLHNLAVASGLIAAAPGAAPGAPGGGPAAAPVGFAPAAR